MINWLKRNRGPKPPAPFPYPLEIVPGSEALAAFERLKREGKGSPVIIGGEKMLTRTIEHLQVTRKRTVEDILRDATKSPFPATLRAEHAALIAKFKQEEPDWPEEEDEPQMGERPVEPIQISMGGPGAAFDASKRQRVDKVHIALIPTLDPTEAFAYLYFGGWNSCPAPHHHVAAARHWRDRYGAELVTIGSDIVEFRVARRPKTREEALLLAREHYDYCSEIEELLTYAAELMASDWWYFWWD